MDATTDGNDLDSSLAAAVRRLDSTAGPDGTMQRAVELAVASLAGCQHAGITLCTTKGQIETTAATSDLVRRGDALQYELGDGPCLSAIREAEVVHSADLTLESRWRPWPARVVEELGVRSMLAFQLFTTTTTLGALNLYSERPDAFPTDDLTEHSVFAAHLAGTLVAARTEENLQAALANRTVIGQAEGMLMERFGIDPSAAFAVLRRVSQARNVKLHQVAAELVRTRRVPGIGTDQG